MTPKGCGLTSVVQGAAGADSGISLCGSRSLVGSVCGPGTPSCFEQSYSLTLSGRPSDKIPEWPLRVGLLSPPWPSPPALQGPSQLQALVRESLICDNFMFQNLIPNSAESLSHLVILKCEFVINRAISVRFLKIAQRTLCMNFSTWDIPGQIV